MNRPFSQRRLVIASILAFKRQWRKSVKSGLYQEQFMDGEPCVEWNPWLQPDVRLSRLHES